VDRPVGKGKFVTKTWCKARVWGNNSVSDDCGKKATAHGLCGEHLRAKKMELKMKLRKVREEERRLGAELACLYSRGGS
jgi:hypothetical protein